MAKQPASQATNQSNQPVNEPTKVSIHGLQTVQSHIDQKGRNCCNKQNQNMLRRR